MSMARVIAYLDAHPDGATMQEIADGIDCAYSSVAQCLGRLQARGQARKGEGSHAGLKTRWAILREPTPPVFKAMETLAAMQSACRAKLTQTAETT